MRKFGTLANQELAQKLTDYLLIQQIVVSAEESSQGTWDMWVRDEDKLPIARGVMDRFLSDPNAAEFQQASQQAKQIRKLQAAEAQRRAKLVRKMPQGAGPGMFLSRPIPVTIGVIVIAIIASLLTKFGEIRGGLAYRIVDGNVVVQDEPFGLKLYRAMMMVDPLDYRYTDNKDPLAEIRKGQVWRLITPIFLHGSIMHLAFNMLAMYSLGGIIERLHGSWVLLLLTLGTGAIASLVQAFTPAALGGSPIALGASGAIFGLFGYLWVRPMLEPMFPIRIPQSSVVMIMGWMFLCMTPIIPNVANAAHVGGLLAGIAVVPLAIKFWPVR
ncbi:Rhomboid protease GlpG [Roseimaritima multifibrata]|uniref:Rhomboid protease GlpG n=1 Tax=Roseimaritima multifibrata TaxID=1930274 RepID=A0A517MF81_9BACT|nr:rhomboid family intramembrane serine protease [Roseimaritima multifibrata]QDS93549.1 Rhomboid protease GlpG [Roseimaritima multifibrata]